MNQKQRAMWALGLSLIIWAPVALGIMGGHIEVATGGMYYLGALLISWIGMGLIMNLTNNYRATVDRVERAKREIEELERRREYEETHRRSTDAATPEKS